MLQDYRKMTYPASIWEGGRYPLLFNLPLPNGGHIKRWSAV